MDAAAHGELERCSLEIRGKERRILAVVGEHQQAAAIKRPRAAIDFTDRQRFERFLGDDGRHGVIARREPRQHLGCAAGAVAAGRTARDIEPPVIGVAFDGDASQRDAAAARGAQDAAVGGIDREHLRRGDYRAGGVHCIPGVLALVVGLHRQPAEPEHLTLGVTSGGFRDQPAAFLPGLDERPGTREAAHQRVVGLVVRSGRTALQRQIGPSLGGLGVELHAGALDATGSDVIAGRQQRIGARISAAQQSDRDDPRQRIGARAAIADSRPEDVVGDGLEAPDLGVEHLGESPDLPVRAEAPHQGGTERLAVRRDVEPGNPRPRAHRVPAADIEIAGPGLGTECSTELCPFVRRQAPLVSGRGQRRVADPPPADDMAELFTEQVRGELKQLLL